MKALDSYSCSVSAIQDIKERKKYAKEFLKKVLNYYDDGSTIDDYELSIDEHSRAHFNKKK